MKKILLIAAVAGFAMTSCKKDYTCECKVTSGSISTTATYTFKDTKKKATDACDAMDAETSVAGISSKTECSIK